jgi:hypothetical protein
MNKRNRRSFIKTSGIAGIGLGLTSNASGILHLAMPEKGKRIGMIGLDTGHCVAFTRSLNDPQAGDTYGGYRVVAAVPEGTELIEEWKNRIPEFTEEVKSHGVEIVDSIPELLSKVDVVIITCIDGNKHLEQSLPVLKAGKRVFIDKPFAASLSDAYSIVEAAKHYNVPMFSSSSLRYIDGADKTSLEETGGVIGAEAYSPAHIEEHHPDLFWYGVHGVEVLFTVMGTGCKTVSRSHTEGTDVVTGIWEDNRIGTYRGIRKGKGGYGGTIFGKDKIATLGPYQGYNPLLVKVVEFFESGIVPVAAEETLEIFAFMQAAEESKKLGGFPVEMAPLMKEARIKGLANLKSKLK